MAELARASEREEAQGQLTELGRSRDEPLTQPHPSLTQTTPFLTQSRPAVSLSTAMAELARASEREEAQGQLTGLGRSSDQPLTQPHASLTQTMPFSTQSRPVSLSTAMAELARASEREEAQGQLTELGRSRDKLEGAAEALHATVGALQSQLAIAEGRAAQEAAARMDQVSHCIYVCVCVRTYLYLCPCLYIYIDLYQYLNWRLQRAALRRRRLRQGWTRRSTVCVCV